ncbi:MAG: hypothetical protein ISN29_11765 [Gammaproteobacteria bacterium AqS3]|nr:hypothetical protein [Gammaproteobacteria bacterium AqS3]
MTWSQRQDMNRLYDERRELSVLKPINEFLDPQSKLIVMHCARGEKEEKLRALNRGDLLVCDLTKERKASREVPAEYHRSRP